LSEIDDIRIVREGLDEHDVHSDITFELVDRQVTQPTATMMVSASAQAVTCTDKDLVERDHDFCAWLENEFRAELGDDAARLLLPR
jgi:hypothetical protein